MNHNNQQTIDSYNAAADKYITKSRNVVSDDLQPWINAGLAKLSKSAKILEIGTASGKTANYMEAKGFTVERSDAAVAFVEFQRKEGHQARVLNVLTDDIGTGYDMIYAEAVLLHFTETEIKRVIAKVYNALKVGGHFLFSLKQGEGEEVNTHKLGKERYFRFWQNETIQPILKEAGFDDIVSSMTIKDYYPGRPEWLLLTAEKGKA
jgi:2-polyprenyl-3-methyl-5-hydroxy-6-metoxy-1,4-benzoquinol methylase